MVISGLQLARCGLWARLDFSRNRFPVAALSWPYYAMSCATTLEMLHRMLFSLTEVIY